MARQKLTDSLVVGGEKVKPTARSLVSPAKRTPEHWLRLSNLDRIVNPCFSSAILFYEKVLVKHNKTFPEVVESLKESLKNVLVEYYPLAGRLELREDGLVDLHCNDQGAVLLEAAVDAELENVGGPQPMPVLSGLDVARLGPGPLYIPDQLRPMPALVIQVTQFKKCGSIAIAVNWHHTVADGTSGCNFMKAWTEIAMGRDLSLKPDHNREQLKAREQPDSSAVRGYSTRRIFAESLPIDAQFLPTQPAILKVFPIPKETAESVKAQSRTDDTEHSTAEAISGFLWQKLTKARTDPNIDSADQTTRFFMFVDGRKKLDLSPGYFGNVVCSACAEAKEGEIMSNPITYGASLIRKATKNISGNYFRALIDWVEEQGGGEAKSEHMLSLGRDVAATFWTYFPLYEMDFGWGKPTFAARNSAPRNLIDGIAMMPSPEGPKSMVAVLNLHEDRMTRLEKNGGLLIKGC